MQQQMEAKDLFELIGLKDYLLAKAEKEIAELRKQIEELSKKK